MSGTEEYNDSKVDAREPTHADLDSKLEQILELIKVLIRHKRSDKLDILERELSQKRSLTVKNVMLLLDVTRPHALTLMRRLRDINLNVRFTPGDRQTQKPSMLTFVGGMEKVRFRKLLALYNRLTIDKKRDYVTMGEIMKELGVDYAEAMSITLAFCENHPEFTLDYNAYEYQGLKSSEGVRLRLKSTSMQDTCSVQGESDSENK